MPFEFSTAGRVRKKFRSLTTGDAERDRRKLRRVRKTIPTKIEDG
jgi:hypothetical protein